MDVRDGAAAAGTRRRVLLFYRDFPENDRFVRGDRHLRRLLRPVYHRLSGKQKVSGFYMWFSLLKRALEMSGCEVRVNDYRAARRSPDEPIGIVGYPSILDDWSLPNPAVLGPGLLDHPNICPGLMDRSPAYRRYIVTCDWVADMFGRVYAAERCALWHAGIDLSEWADTRAAGADAKSVDFLLYDKVRWDRDRYEPGLINPIREELDRRGLTHETIRYRYYQHEDFRDALRRCRAMVFLCEHETQGMAYQEALASNVPVLAWDNGFWLDPRRPQWDPEPVPASSVPYFGPECGERFRDIEGFAPALDTFLARRDTYAPREFVARELSMTGSARLYLAHLDAAEREQRASAGIRTGAVLTAATAGG
jgi:glycosyltransferase involved in cell wall biosynthesis